MARGGHAADWRRNGREISYLLTAMESHWVARSGTRLNWQRRLMCCTARAPPMWLTWSSIWRPKLRTAGTQFKNGSIGSAWKKFISLVEAQDGSASVLEENRLRFNKAATPRNQIRSRRQNHCDGRRKRSDALSFLLGGGRQQVDDKIDLAVGISNLKKVRECATRRTAHACACANKRRS